MFITWVNSCSAAFSLSSIVLILCLQEFSFSSSLFLHAWFTSLSFHSKSSRSCCSLSVFTVLSLSKSFSNFACIDCFSAIALSNACNCKKISFIAKFIKNISNNAFSLIIYHFYTYVLYTTFYNEKKNYTKVKTLDLLLLCCCVLLLVKLYFYHVIISLYLRQTWKDRVKFF